MFSYEDIFPDRSNADEILAAVKGLDERDEDAEFDGWMEEDSDAYYGEENLQDGSNEATIPAETPS